VYLKALSDPNKTEVVRERIISVADASVFTEDGGQHQIDVISDYVRLWMPYHGIDIEITIYIS
jgi:hypothetical protein